MSNVWNKEHYRLQQEAFVSNHGGTTSREVVYALLPNVCSILLTTTTLGLIGKYLHKNIRVLIEFILNVVPCILCCTVLSEHVIIVSLSMMLVCFVNIVLMGVRVQALSNYDVKPVQGRRPFITNFRAMANIMTAVCILAIDFRIFPRKFAKTEVFGYSLMDSGVGLFVLANALVAPEAKDFGYRVKGNFLYTLVKNMKQATKSCIPLLLLGFGRSIAIEFTGYQKHVTEYGIHWNFFITLAFVKLFTSSITSTINSKYSLLSGIWILAMHEYILSTKGLKEWVLSNEARDDFVSANREGVVSVPGYAGLYLIGVAIGRLIHSTYLHLSRPYAFQSKHKSFHMEIYGYQFDASYNESMVLCVKLSLIAAQTCAATLFCDAYFRVSRRLANAGYCMWILTLGVMMLTLLLLVEIIIDMLACTSTTRGNTSESKNNKYPRANSRLKRERIGSEESEENTISRTLEIFEAVNYNGLFFFLLSNLLTGSINMSILTLYVKELKALQILIGYMAITIMSAFVLYRSKIQIKL